MQPTNQYSNTHITRMDDSRAHTKKIRIQAINLIQKEIIFCGTKIGQPNKYLRSARCVIYTQTHTSCTHVREIFYHLSAFCMQLSENIKHTLTTIISKQPHGKHDDDEGAEKGTRTNGIEIAKKRECEREKCTST